MSADGHSPNDYYNIRNLTRFGPATVPGYSMVPNRVASRRQEYTPTPGPGAYYPENYETLGTRTPAFSLAGRLNPPANWKSDLPAPNDYQADICVMTNCLNKNKAKSFGIRWNENKATASSTVPFYSVTNLNAYKQRTPTYKMAPPVAIKPLPNYDRFPMTPGPSDYIPHVARNSPAFSFGTKYSGNVSTMRTQCEYQLI